MNKRGFVILVAAVFFLAISELLQSANLPVINEFSAKESQMYAMSRFLDNTNNNDKPLFVLHVGPPKTGTTTIQWVSSKQRNYLKENNIYYLGHGGNRKSNLHQLNNLCADRDDLDKQEMCIKAWKKFNQIIQSHHDQGHNVFVSDELFAKSHSRNETVTNIVFDNLVALQENWNVRVIYTYRRYYEWMVSSYFQAFNPNPPPKGQLVEKLAEKRLKWPGSGGRETMDFSSFLIPRLGTNRTIDPLYWKKNFDDHFANVVTFNMHNTTSERFIQDFFCTMIPEAQVLCNQLENPPVDFEAKNPSAEKYLHYDMIALGAFQRGWVRETLPRYAVSQAIRQYSSKELGLLSMADFDLACPSAQNISALLELSLKMEQELVPKFYASTRGESSLRANFAQFLEKKKFCSVNVNETLKNDNWESFFKTRLAYA